MRARRQVDQNNILFDYKELFDKKLTKGKKLIQMIEGPRSWESAEGTKFWIDHPYKWVETGEAEWLLQVKYPKFKTATLNEVEDYYSY